MKLQSWKSGKERYEWEQRTARVKLSPEIVRKARAMTGAQVRALARELGCSAQIIFKARRRAGWTWVED